MNKIIASIILAVILILGINKITDIIFYVEKPAKSAYQIEIASTTATETTSISSGAGSEDIMALLATTSAADGKVVFKKCLSCHSIAKGKRAKIGPNLYNIWRQVGSTPDYKYSKALVAYGKTWDFQELNGFLTNPKKWIPKNKMGFIGLKKPEDRAAVILYLNENTDNPLPLQ